MKLTDYIIESLQFSGMDRAIAEHVVRQLYQHHMTDRVLSKKIKNLDGDLEQYAACGDDIDALVSRVTEIEAERMKRIGKTFVLFPPTPVIVADTEHSPAMQKKYGKRYGVDWVYAKDAKKTLPHPKGD